MRFSATVEVKKCSKKFDKRPHRRYAWSVVPHWIAISLKIAPSPGDQDPIVPWSHHPNHQPKRHLDRFSRFAGLTIVTDRRTDRQTTLLGL